MSSLYVTPRKAAFAGAIHIDDRKEDCKGDQAIDGGCQ
jgi:hypothetical protein